MEVESKPEKSESRPADHQLKIGREALKKEPDAASRNG
jgi:hypothetical protein